MVYFILNDYCQWGYMMMEGSSDEFIKDLLVSVHDTVGSHPRLKLRLNLPVM